MHNLREKFNKWLENHPTFNNPVFNKTLVSFIRRITPMSIANQIVGVQPMSGPAGQIFKMKYMYSTPEKSEEEEKDK